MRVAIVDDEALARARMQRLLGAIDGVEVAACCDSADALLALLRREAIDALMLDVRMPGLDGMELAALIRDRRLPIVFVTAHADHAVDAFAVGALDYLLKPVDPARLREAVARLRQHRDAPAERLAIETAQGVVLVQPRDIACASFDGQLVTLVVRAQSGTRELCSTWSLNALLDRLPPGVLERVHRRHLLNLDHLDRLERSPSGGYIAWMNGGVQVEVSRQAGRQLRRRFGW